VQGEPDLSKLTPIPAVGSADELAVKSSWLEQMTGTQAAGRYPNLTSVSIFNYFKEANLTQFNDYRYIGGKSDVEAWTRSYVGNVTAYQGGFTGSALSTCPNMAYLFWALLLIYCASF